MDFGFSEQQRDVQQLARQILSEQVTPEKLAAYDDYAAERFDQELWQQLADAGLLGVAIAEQHGGMGFGFIELALLVEEVGRSIAPLPAISHAVSAALTIQRFGSDAQRETWLPPAVRGETILTAGLGEASTACTVQGQSAGSGWILSGGTAYVPYAAVAERILLPAETEEGTIMVLLDPQAPGVSLTGLPYTTYEPLYELACDAVEIEAGDVLAGPADGVAVLRWATERSMAAVCAHQLGVTDVSMRMTASYTAEREQFGVPVATFQAVGHRAANCFIDVECLRLNTWQAVSLLDADADATTEVQIAKIWAGDVGHRVSYASQHMHGGTGIDRDYPLWRYCLWARHNETVLGGSARQLAALGERIAAGDASCN